MQENILQAMQNFLSFFCSILRNYFTVIFVLRYLAIKSCQLKHSGSQTLVKPGQINTSFLLVNPLNKDLLNAIQHLAFKKLLPKAVEPKPENSISTPSNQVST